MNRPDIVDIIVPIYNAPEYTKKCIECVLTKEAGYKFNLILINDASPDLAVNELLEKIKDKRVIILNNEKNLGFVGTCNRGLEYSKNDAVLLNSDTEVTHNWLKYLVNAAYSSEKVGTVSPFTNSGAGILNVPDHYGNNSIPDGYDLESWAKTIHGISSSRYPEVLANVGYCLYIKRSVIDKIGILDYETFGLGYGEEADFCLRAHRAGFKNIVADDTFIQHEGSSVSFSAHSEKRIERVQNATKIINERYPEFQPWLDDFLTHDPFSDIHQNIWFNSTFFSKKETVMHLIHQPIDVEFGGIEIFTKMIANYADKYDHFIVYIGNGHTEILNPRSKQKLFIPNDVKRDTYKLENKNFEEHFEFVLKLIDPNVLHFESLNDQPISLLKTAFKFNIATILHLHDFSIFYLPYWQLELDNQSIKENVTAINMKISNENDRANEIAYYEKRFALLSEYLPKITKVIAPSKFVKTKVEEDFNATVEVVENGISNSTHFKKSPIENRIRVGWVGAFNKHKGAEKFLEIIEKDSENKFDWIIAGKITDDQKDLQVKLDNVLRNNSNVTFTGEFSNEELDSVFKKIDLLLLPAQVAETFSFVLSEALIRKIPVLSSDLGAIGARMKEYNLAKYTFKKDAYVDETWNLLNRFDQNHDLLNQISIRSELIATREQTVALMEKIYDSIKTQEIDFSDEIRISLNIRRIEYIIANNENAALMKMSQAQKLQVQLVKKGSSLLKKTPLHKFAKKTYHRIRKVLK